MIGCWAGRSVTPGKPSHPAECSPSPPLRGARMLTIVIGTDEVGSKARLLRDEDALPGGEMRWRLVAKTDDQEVAAGVMGLLIRRWPSARGVSLKRH